MIFLPDIANQTWKCSGKHYWHIIHFLKYEPVFFTFLIHPLIYMMAYCSIWAHCWLSAHFEATRINIFTLTMDRMTFSFFFRRFHFYWTVDSVEAYRRRGERGGYGMKQRSLAEIEPGMLQLHGMNHKHFATGRPPNLSLLWPKWTELILLWGPTYII